MEERILSLVEAREQLGLPHVEILRRAIHAGELRAELMHRPQPGAPAWMIEDGELARWVEARGLNRVVTLSPRMQDVVVPVTVAAHLVSRTRNNLIQAIQRGDLRAVKLDLDGRLEHWQVRLGDLANWFSKPGRGTRRKAARTFNPKLMAQLEALVNGSDPPDNGSGPTR